MQYTFGGFLMHHGIAGQKHGVRHGPPYPIRRDSSGRPLAVVRNKSDTKRIIKMTSDRQTPARPKPQSDVRGPTERRVKKKVRVSEMPDELLRARIQRLELERKYKDLVRAPQSVDRGKKPTNSALQKYGDIVITNSLNTGFRLLNATIDNAFSRPKK